MIGTAAAIIASAAISAGSSAIAANSAKKGIQGATAAETASNNQALALQERQFNQTRADNEPWRQVGLGALQQLSRTYNINLPASTWAGTVQPTSVADLTPRPYPGAPASGVVSLASKIDPAGYAAAQQRAETAWNASEAQRVSQAQQQATAQAATIQQPMAGQPSPAGQFGDFFASPDYNFRVNQGVTAITGNKAARGLLDSGALGKGLINYGQQAGAQEYGSWFNHLASLAGLGQSATQSNIAAGAANTNAQSGIIQNQGQNLSSSYQTQAGINAGLINNLGQTAGGLIKNYPWGGSGGGGAASSIYDTVHLGGGGLYG